MSVIEPAIVVEGLKVVVQGTGNDIVDDISFTIAPGEVLGLVGESGSGKTTAALALLGHTRRGAEIAGGSVRIGDSDVLQLGQNDRRRLRGRVISYVPQDPAAALNPGAADRHPADGGARGARRRRRRRGAQGAGGRDDARGGAARRRRLPAPLPARALGRPAAAGRPGHGVCLPAAGDRAGRADDRPRRDHPGARARHDPRPGRRAPGRRPVREPRSRRRGHAGRPGGGDVRRPDRRAEPVRGALPHGRPPVHPPAGRGRAAPRRQPRAGRDPRPGAVAGPAARGLLVRAPLHAGRGALHRRDAGAAADRGRPTAPAASRPSRCARRPRR